MAYTDSLLADGEIVAMRSRQHWLAVALDARTAIALWIVAALLFVVSIVIQNATIQNILGIIILALVAIGFVVFGYRWLRWINEDYVVTNRRILKVSGIVNKRSMDSSLEKINDLILEENLLGRLLDYGDLDILTASEAAIDRFRMLHHAKTFKKEMLEQKHSLEQGDFYRPGPPLMAAGAAAPEPLTQPPGPPPAAPPPAAAPPVGVPVPDAAAVPAPMPAVQASPAGPGIAEGAEARGAGESVASETTARGVADEDEARDVTRTLARLADLRDRGAITTEEYEAKKTELLGRL